MRRTSKLSAVCLSILLAACVGGFLDTFRLGIASSRPLAESLAAAGLIPKEKIDVIVADFDAGAQCGQTIRDDFRAIPKDLSKPEIKKLKFEASNKGLQCFEEIEVRHNFAIHPRIQKAANIAHGILASLVLFYGNGVSTRSAPTSPDVVYANSEGELQRKLKTKMGELEEAMKP